MGRTCGPEEKGLQEDVKVPVAPAGREAAASKFIAQAPKPAEPELADDWAPPAPDPRASAPAPTPAREPRAAAASAAAGSTPGLSSHSGSRMIHATTPLPPPTRVPDAPRPMMSAATAPPEAD